jgi:hypothetical protein
MLQAKIIKKGVLVLLSRNPVQFWSVRREEKMRTTIFFILFYLLTICSWQAVLAQNADSKEQPIKAVAFDVSLIEIIKPQVNNNAVIAGGANIPMPSMRNNTSSSSPRQVLHFGLKIKNEASKEVKEVFWEVSFLDNDKKLTQKSFKTSKNIKPGEENLLDQEMDIDFKMISSATQFGVKVLKIKYKDKSEWIADANIEPTYTRIRVE